MRLELRSVCGEFVYMCSRTYLHTEGCASWGALRRSSRHKDVVHRRFFSNGQEAYCVFLSIGQKTLYVFSFKRARDPSHLFSGVYYLGLTPIILALTYSWPRFRTRRFLFHLTMEFSKRHWFRCFKVMSRTLVLKWNSLLFIRNKTLILIILRNYFSISKLGWAIIMHLISISLVYLGFTISILSVYSRV